MPGRPGGAGKQAFRGRSVRDMNNERAIDGRPLVFGEVLFDSFPDGAAVLGGAPFNVAWHLQGFGQDPLFVSRIGADERGDRVLEAMREWGMDVSGVQRDDMRSTGEVTVTFDSGQPRFNIRPEQAYDYIDAAAAALAIGRSPVALLYHGTLALRGDMSRSALHVLRDDKLVAAVCVDINLRDPWWDHALVHEVLQRAGWAKVNDDELTRIAETNAAAGDPEQEARALRSRFGIGSLVVTQGDEGAFVVCDDDLFRGSPAPVAGMIDTVGAGDAFSAVSLLGMMRGWPVPRTLERALEFASRICSVRGATVQDKAMYSSYLSKWENG